jgi:hypothetical protein
MYLWVAPSCSFSPVQNWLIPRGARTLVGLPGWSPFIFWSSNFRHKSRDHVRWVPRKGGASSHFIGFGVPYKMAWGALEWVPHMIGFVSEIFVRPKNLSIRGVSPSLCSYRGGKRAMLPSWHVHTSVFILRYKTVHALLRGASICPKVLNHVFCLLDIRECCILAPDT